MSVRYKDFKFAIRREFWPFPGEALSLIPAHDKFFSEAMSQLQKWVPCLCQHHTNVFKACSTYVSCGLTLLPMPVGIVRRVYTIANDEWCDPVYASARSFKEVLQWQRGLMLRFTQPENANMPALQQGIRFAEPSTDTDNGRSRTGIWASDRDKLYYAPWIQSNESIVIEWDGFKSDWSDDDMLDENYWTPDAAAVVKLYVAKCHERDFGGDSARLKTFTEEYREKLGDLVYWCQKETQNQENRDAEELNTRPPTQAEVIDDEPPTADEEDIVAFIADWSGGAGSVPVSNLVKSWNPKYIVTGGDNWYDATVTKEDLDAQAHIYSEFMFPYNGTLGEGAEASNAFFTALGNHDRDPAGHYQIHQNYFNRPRDYYDFVSGNVHWFIIDGGYMNNKVTVAQVDGNTFDSVQGEYFKLKMALSTARWKIVVVHFTTYCSTHVEFPDLRWPFKNWGADLLLHGDFHAYERLLNPDGLPIVIGGWSGRPLDPFVAISPYSLARYNAQNGAVKLSVTINQLKMEAINYSGTVIDTLTLTKA